MFENCVNIKILDIRNFNTKKVADMSRMFKNCKKLENLYFSKQFKKNKI